METMTNELTVIPRTIGMVTRMMDAVNIEDAVIVSEEEQKEHPNFIESNTSGITLEELERNCIVPSFGDNQLTISHQKFIHQVEDAAKVYFTGENFGNTEIRVSHKILGRVPGPFSSVSYITDIPKLFITLFLLSVIRNMRGCSPFDNTLLLKQITETLILIALKVVQRFTLWFTLTLILSHFYC